VDPLRSNRMVQQQRQPISQRYNFKLGKGRVKKIDTTDLVGKMSFVPRNLV
jgi:hypothetical protein